jgi:site-specific recombinase XerD
MNRRKNKIKPGSTAKTLKEQSDKVISGTNEKSFKTRKRHKASSSRYLDWVGKEFKVQKIQNTKAKHIIAYVEFMKKKGYAANTIKVELAGIRFVYEKSGGRNLLPSNKDLNLEKVVVGGVQRAWNEREFNAALDLAKNQGRVDVVLILSLCRLFGLRLEGAVTLEYNQIRSAIYYAELVVKEKGGLVRAIPVETEAQRDLLMKLLSISKPGNRIFVTPEKGTLKLKASVQKWVYNHRKEFEDADRKNFDQVADAKKNGFVEKSHISVHGNRHSYSQNRMRDLESKGLTKNQARKQVSEELGHHRLSITSTYMANKKRD